jgi:L-ascorbate metabolism protein UlaG (beta-lactamase superfamily)
MSITVSYLGHSSFRIKGKNVSVVMDPFGISAGLHFPKQKADIVTISHDHKDHNNKEGISNEDCYFVQGPGEYEIKEVMVYGYRSYHDKKEGEERGKNVIYLVEMEGLTFCHLGDLGTTKVDPKFMKEIEGCNVLFIPVGGKYTIDSGEAKEMIAKIEPNYVVPMHYKTLGLSEAFNDLAELGVFLNEMGVEVEAQPKLVVSEMNLPEETEVVVLERKK